MSEWSERYRAYLRSPEWQEKRLAVFERAGGVCESCREAPAEEVHHETYDNVFREPLWDLRAVCAECRSEQLQRRMAIYQALHPETRRGETGRGAYNSCSGARNT